VIWELNEKHPIVDLSLFKSKNFALGTVAFCLGYAVFFGSNLLQPLWLQTQMHYIATWAGLVAAPSGVVAVLLTPFAARIMQKVDARWTATLSLAAFSLSFYMRSGFTPDVDFKALVWPMLVQGVAMSTFFLSMVTISLNGVAPQQLPSASGLSNFTRITAGSFAASLTTTIWDRGEDLHQNRIAETMASNDPTWLAAVEHMQAAGMSHAQAVGSVTASVVNQAYLLSTLDFFRASAWLTVLLIPLIWMTNKAMSGGGAHAAAD
jgi:DHA2 family multidrug resistance protein